MNRRHFLHQAAILSATTASLPFSGCESDSHRTPSGRKPPFKISLAEWSYHKALFAKKMSHLDFPLVARRDHGIDAIELVNQFFMDQATDRTFLAEFKRRCAGEGVSTELIMCDDEGNLGDPDSNKRRQAVRNHYKWADAAQYLGCHSIRVNAETEGMGSFQEQQERAADGLHELTLYCGKLGLNCIVENHGHLSSNGAWLSGVMRLINLPNAGTLPDFGNFSLGDGTWYDRYKGVAELMPFAKAVSAKSYDFDARGNCIETDYRRMMKIVLDAGYHDWVGIEYEGEHLPERDGVQATLVLLNRIRTESTGVSP